MARSRNIKPGFFKNEILAEMPTEARLLFIGLWTLADREGRLEDRPKRIKGELFAFDSFDVDSMLTRLQADGFVTRYEAGGVRYIQVENFVKHQDPHYKEKASEIPAPDGRENLVLASGVTRTQRARILERDGYLCLGCGSKEHLCIDHILPVSRGGDSSDENLQTLCLSCNTKKGNKLDGETKNSYLLRDRVDFDSRLAQVRRSKPSDSPLSDSLIPDSLIPDSLPSVAKATGGTPPKLTDPKEIIFGFGLSLLVNAGTPEKQARSFLGGRVKEYTEVGVIDVLRDCAKAKPLQPLEWLAAAMPPKGAPRLNAQEALEASNRAVLARFLEKDTHAAQ